LDLGLASGRVGFQECEARVETRAFATARGMDDVMDEVMMILAIREKATRAGYRNDGKDYPKGGVNVC